MGSIAKTCLRSLLKVANSAMGIVGIMLILYSCWMIRVWQRDSSYVDYSSTGPWFMYTFLGIGVTMGVITCLGHIAADSAHGYCLSCYVVIISFLLLLETAMSADILLNSDWEKDLPEDPTGRFHDFKDFVKSNFDFCKWIGFMIILAQMFTGRCDGSDLHNHNQHAIGDSFLCAIHASLFKDIFLRPECTSFTCRDFLFCWQ
ncbi:hypothetical protein I3842_10G046700 [Carya illinoinensis]|uniref:Tetraspanin-19-like n=1 Tax=Carya illinoinensis TaxID=32201 RepID=A0A922A332_CARIL|nr:hypothetical protein I3842_Q023400 [Carya illinoinensis]KAG6691073.1 hypothetical protein I3842_10G046700 [Carya illinoinensis]